jgi:hypothetical protein
VAPTWAIICCAPNPPQTGYIPQPLDLILMGAEQAGHLLVELAHLLLDELQLF